MQKTYFPVLFRSVLLVLSLLLISYVLENIGFQHFLEREWIDQNIRRDSVTDYGYFFVIGVLTTAIGLPRQIVAFSGGYVFGLFFGFLIAALATFGGCILAFYYSRFFGRKLVQHLFPAKLKKFDGFVRDNPLLKILFIRLFPVGNNLLTNLIAGISSIKKSRFFIGSFLGYLPQTLIFSLLGSGLTLDSQWQVGISVLLMIIVSLIGIYLFNKMKEKI